MTDYCTQTPTEQDLDLILLSCGLCVETDDGSVVPASSNILLDRIGPITMGDVTYPDYYANIRLLVEPTEEQVTALSACAIDPSQPQYRVWC